MAELRQVISTHTVEKTSVSKAWVIAKLVENVERAMQAVRNPTGDYTYQDNVANRALELIGTVCFDLGVALCHRLLDGATHSTAFKTLPNSARMPSPAVSIMRPVWSVIMGRTTPWCPLEVQNSAHLVCAHQGAVPRNIGCKNCRQPTGNLWIFGVAPFRWTTEAPYPVGSCRPVQGTWVPLSAFG